MYKHDQVLPDADSQLSKKEQVAQMFNRISGKYDFFNRLLSAGIDVKWRKKALNQLKGDKIDIMLDVATGTADLAIMAHKILTPSKIIGIDISEGMLNLGKEKVKKRGLEAEIELQIGDSEAINYADDTFDAVTVAYGIRNFENLNDGLTEIKRVLKGKGKLMVLEFSKPKNKLWSKFYHIYMKVVAPQMVSAFSNNKKAYQYLNNSVDAFPERNDLIEVLEKNGFKNCSYKELSFGICCIYLAEK